MGILITFLKTARKTLTWMSTMYSKDLNICHSDSRYDIKSNKNSTFDASFFSSDSSIMVQFNDPNLTETSNMLQSDSLEALFIGNLDERVTEKMLYEIFKIYPSFVSAKLCVGQETRISLKHGYLNFAQKQDAIDASYRFNYTYLFGKEIKIMPSMRHGSYKKSKDRNIIFLNLPTKKDPELTTRRFFEMLTLYGRVISCKLDYEKGIGYCSFEDKSLAERVAALLNNSMFCGGQIKCSVNDISKPFNGDTLLSNNLILPRSSTGKRFHDSETFHIPSELQPKIKNGKTILVGNLPYQKGTSEIKEFFEAYGTISKIHIYRNSHDKKIMYLIVYQKYRACENTFGYLNGTNYKGKILKMEYINRQKTFMTLTNLSVICNINFLRELVKQQGFSYRNLQITNYDLSTTNYKGFIVATDESAADSIFHFFNHKLLCGNVVGAIRY